MSELEEAEEKHHFKVGERLTLFCGANPVRFVAAKDFELRDAVRQAMTALIFEAEQNSAIKDCEVAHILSIQWYSVKEYLVGNGYIKHEEIKDSRVFDPYSLVNVERRRMLSEIGEIHGT